MQVKGANGSGNLTDVVALEAGYLHSIAVKSDGSAWSFGYNAYGQLGDGTVTNRTTPVQVKGGESGDEYLTDMMSVSGGSSHSTGIKKDGSVWSFGYNAYGQIGDGTTTQRNTPVQVQIGTRNHLRLEKGTLSRDGKTHRVDIRNSTLLLNDTSTTTLREGETLSLDTGAIRGTYSFNLFKGDTYVPTGLSYKSINEKVAEVTDAGVIRALKPGIAYIVVEDSAGAKGSIRVQVSPKSAKNIAYPQVASGERHAVSLKADGLCRSEERRVGKECRSRWSPYH